MKKNWITLLMIFVLLFSNFIWSFLAIIIAVIHIPYSVRYSADHRSLIIRVRQT